MVLFEFTVVHCCRNGKNNMFVCLYVSPQGLNLIENWFFVANVAKISTFDFKDNILAQLLLMRKRRKLCQLDSAYRLCTCVREEQFSESQKYRLQNLRNSVFTGSEEFRIGKVSKRMWLIHTSTKQINTQLIESYNKFHLELYPGYL